MVGSFFRAIWREIFPPSQPAGRDVGAGRDGRAGRAGSAGSSTVFRAGRAGRSPSGIEFRDLPPDVGHQEDIDIKDLVDAITQVALNRDTPLYQCRECQVFYQHASYEVIRRENRGRCVCCGQAKVSLAAGAGGGRGRNAAVSVVTLGTYAEHIGRVVTFEGRVVKVLESNSGVSFAAMFEDRSWRDGFKMVVLERDLRAVGGPRFMRNLAHRTVRVHGLLVRHPIFGDQIIITDRTMIQAIS